MAVKVHTGRTEKTHEGGNHVAVRDGHLHVLSADSSSPDTVAIYAPGHWAWSTVNEESAGEEKSQRRGVIVG
ncbi:hypothetical protein [Terrabacter sp. NPDC000476]|uniref:hypothetical protein n=1 Tax=Terrabacter sp. NPDC000476 TaxID=3154258 RepID=UPI0033173CA3